MLLLLGNLQQPTEFLKASLFHPMHQFAPLIFPCNNTPLTINGRTKYEPIGSPYYLYTPGKCIAWLTSNGRSGEPGVSSQGSLTRITPFASLLGESGNPVTDCNPGLWADIDIRPLLGYKQNRLLPKKDQADKEGSVHNNQSRSE